MSLSDDPILPSEPPKPPREDDSAAQRVRRRRATRRSSIPTDAEGQAALISSLARRAYPSIELFIFSLVCGVVLGLGYLFNSQALILLGILVAPLMTPWVGFLLALLTGSIRFLFETIMALLISIALVFLGGLLTGFAAQILPDLARDNIYIHSRLWLPTLIVLAIGAITLVISFARSEDKPFLPSVIIAFAFFPPINAVGFAISAGLNDVWLQGMLVFLTHFTLAGALGLLTLFILRLKPSIGGIIFSGISFIVFVGFLIAVMSSGNPFQAAAVATPTSAPIQADTAPPSPTQELATTPTASPRPSATSAARTPSQTISPIPLTLNVTLPPTETPTITMTIQPTPTYGRISANEGGGANLRESPGGTYVMTLLNGTIVETYSEFQELNGITWVKVYITLNGQQIEGWLLESVIAYATPAPNFEASSTPTLTSTPGTTATP